MLRRPLPSRVLVIALAAAGIALGWIDAGVAVAQGQKQGGGSVVILRPAAREAVSVPDSGAPHHSDDQSEHAIRPEPLCPPPYRFTDRDGCQLPSRR